MYILELMKKAHHIPGTRLGSSLLFTDPIFISKDQPTGEDTSRCACTYFREHAMIFISPDDAIEWIRSREGAGCKIAGMFGAVKK